MKEIKDKCAMGMNAIQEDVATAISSGCNGIKPYLRGLMTMCSDITQREAEGLLKGAAVRKNITIVGIRFSALVTLSGGAAEISAEGSWKNRVARASASLPVPAEGGAEALAASLSEGIARLAEVGLDWTIDEIKAEKLSNTEEQGIAPEDTLEAARSEKNGILGDIVSIGEQWKGKRRGSKKKKIKKLPGDKARERALDREIARLHTYGIGADGISATLGTPREIVDRALEKLFGKEGLILSIGGIAGRFGSARTEEDGRETREERGIKQSGTKYSNE